MGSQRCVDNPFSMGAQERGCHCSQIISQYKISTNLWIMISSDYFLIQNINKLLNYDILRLFLNIEFQETCELWYSACVYLLSWIIYHRYKLHLFNMNIPTFLAKNYDLNFWNTKFQISASNFPKAKCAFDSISMQGELCPFKSIHISSCMVSMVNIPTI